MDEMVDGGNLRAGIKEYAVRQKFATLRLVRHYKLSPLRCWLTACFPPIEVSGQIRPLHCCHSMKQGSKKIMPAYQAQTSLQCRLNLRQSACPNRLPILRYLGTSRKPVVQLG